MMPLNRMKSSAELVNGRRDGSHVTFDKFDPSEWTGDMEKHKPTEFYVRTEEHEVGPGPKDLATNLVRLIDHVMETADNLTDLVSAFPVHDVAGKVLKAEIQAQLRHLTEPTEN